MNNDILIDELDDEDKEIEFFENEDMEGYANWWYEKHINSDNIIEDMRFEAEFNAFVADSLILRYEKIQIEIQREIIKKQFNSFFTDLSIKNIEQEWFKLIDVVTDFVGQAYVIERNIEAQKELLTMIFSVIEKEKYDSKIENKIDYIKNTTFYEHVSISNNEVIDDRECQKHTNESN